MQRKASLPREAYPVRLTVNNASNTNPAWSPDSSKIAFISDKDGTKDLWLMNRDGSGQAKVFASPRQENGPSFSPAGDRIVFSSTSGGAAVLMTVSPNGTGLAPLTSGAFNDWEPSWGTAGIVFSSNRDGAGWKLWRVQPDGTGLAKIGEVPGHDPVWLPNGEVLFLDESLPSSKALAALSVVNPTTGIKRVVVHVQGYSAPIDVRPNRTPNRVFVRGIGRIPVSILSTPTFDATKGVVQSSLTFGRTGSEASLHACFKVFRDVNGDGLPDLTCRFSLRSAGFQQDSTTAVLRFNDTGSKPYEGRDTIVAWPGEDPEDLRD